MESVSDSKHIIRWSLKIFVFLLSICMTSVSFGQIEICDNGIDDDFDNLIDLNDDDCYCVITEPISLIPNPSFESLTNISMLPLCN